MGWELFPKPPGPQPSLWPDLRKLLRGSQADPSFGFRRTGGGDGATLGFNKCPRWWRCRQGWDSQEGVTRTLEEVRGICTSGKWKEDPPNITDPFWSGRWSER